MSIQEFVKKVKSGEISVLEYTHKAIEECKKINSEYNYFNYLAEKEAIEQAKLIEQKIKNKGASGKLLGLPISVKDCICVKDMPSSAGSKILEDYRPVFDATVIERAKAEGAIIIGKTAQDVFGFGSFSVNVGLGFKIPKHPDDKERATGGSSGGSSGITAKASFAHVSLGESTGGSIAAPAAFCGVAGLTPTYGRVSRYGLIDYANSMDKIGPISKSIEDSALMLSVISGHDSKDSTSLPAKPDNYESFVGKSPKGMKLAVPKEFFSESIDKDVKAAVWAAVKKLEKQGVKYEEVSLPLNAEYGIAVYYLIAVSEASTNLAKYSGLRYGLATELKGTFDEYFTEVRSKYFSAEEKRRIILGTFARMSGFRDAYYLRAMKARTKMINEYKQVFKKFDAILHPAMPIVAPKFSEISKLTPLQNFLMDICTVPANLGGFPHLSVNVAGKGKLPIGAMLTSDHLNEKALVQLGSALEGSE